VAGASPQPSTTSDLGDLRLLDVFPRAVAHLHPPRHPLGGDQPAPAQSHRHLPGPRRQRGPLPALLPHSVPGGGPRPRPEHLLRLAALLHRGRAGGLPPGHLRHGPVFQSSVHQRLRRACLRAGHRRLPGVGPDVRLGLVLLRRSAEPAYLHPLQWADAGAPAHHGDAQELAAAGVVAQRLPT